MRSEFEQRIIYTHERILTVTVNNIEHIESTSYNGIGVMKVFLQPGASVDAAVAQITASAQTVLRLMPPGMHAAVDHPVQRLLGADLAIQLQQHENVGAGTVRRDRQPGARRAFHRARRDVPWPYGGKTRVVSVDIDLAALKAKNLAAQDVVNAINAQNLVLPSGTAKIGATEYNVAVNTNPRLIDDLNDLPIKTVNGADDSSERRGAGARRLSAAAKRRAPGRRARRAAHHPEGGRGLDARRGATASRRPCPAS